MAAILRYEGGRFPWGAGPANTMLVTEALPHGCGALSLRSSIELIPKESPPSLRTAKTIDKVK